MGRVAKYKKVKSFDPYSKKNRGNIDLPTVGVWGLGDDGRRAKKRSQKAEKMHARKHKLNGKKGNRFLDDGGYDAPVMDKDEFDMADLMGSVKKQKLETADTLGGTDVSKNASLVASTKKGIQKATSESYDKIVTSTGNVANIPKTNEDELKVTRLLRLDKQEQQKSEKEKQSGHARMEGESKRAYAKRTRAETREIIKQSTATKNHEKLQRKKEFLKNKKKNKKRKRGGLYSYDEDENNDGGAYDGSSNAAEGGRAKDSSSDDPVRFGEQAERPPIFRQIPRGAKSKSSATIKAAAAAKSTKIERMSEQQIEAERDAMELMRRRIQAQYKAIKSKRKDAGDFHL
jgi:hypothetical protein